MTVSSSQSRHASERHYPVLAVTAWAEGRHFGGFLRRTHSRSPEPTGKGGIRLALSELLDRQVACESFQFVFVRYRVRASSLKTWGRSDRNDLVY